MAVSRRTSPRRLSRSASALPGRFAVVVKDYQRDVQAGLEAADPKDRDRALQRRLSSYDVAHLERFFGERRLAEIGDRDVVDYVLRRQGEPLATVDAINGELWTLGKIYRFATQEGLIKQDDWPRIEFLRRETPPRPVPADQRLWQREDMALRRQEVELQRQRLKIERSRRDARTSPPVDGGGRRVTELTGAEWQACIEEWTRDGKRHAQAWWAGRLKDKYKLIDHTKNIAAALRERRLPPHLYQQR